VGVLKDYLARNPTDAEGWVTYAESLHGLQRWEEAADAAQRAVDLDPKSLDRWRALTYCLAMLNGQTKNGNPVVSAKLKEVAQHDLAMGDDSNIAYYALIQAAEAQGDKEKAAQLRQQYEKLKESGELADYEFGKEQRYFGKQIMLPAEQVAKSLGLELTDKTFFLGLNGQGHSFSLTIDGKLVLVDGIKLEVSTLPVRYKHQRYYLDSNVVFVVIKGVLNPEKIRIPFGTPSPPEFRIQNIWLEKHLPPQAQPKEPRPTPFTSGQEVTTFVEDTPPTHQYAPEAQHDATQKLIDAALKVDPSLFKHEVESFSKHGLIIGLQCEQSNDLAEDCQIATKLGDKAHWEFIPEETPDALVSGLAEVERARLENVFQILFARTIVANFAKAKVTASTAFESLPHPTKNPSLVIHIMLPNSKGNSDDSFETIARSLSQSAALLNSELSK
jgi:tetratricopeptide (TPR) repeat protein